MCKILKLVIFTLAVPLLHTHGEFGDSSNDCGQLEYVPDDLRSLAPWTAMIYFRKNVNSEFQFHTSGVVIGSKTVLSIAGGYYGANYSYKNTSQKYSLQPPHHVRIGLGLSSTDLSTADPDSQLVTVRYILPFTKHEAGNKEFHYLIYELESALNLQTPFVKAVCLSPTYLDPFQKHMVQSGFQKLPSKENNAAMAVLRIFNITTGTQMECEREFGETYARNFRSHVFCAKLKNDESCLLHGSNAVIQDDEGRWSLVGLTVLIPTLRNGFCGGETINFYSRSSGEAISWFQNNIKCNEINEFPCGGNSCIKTSSLCDLIKDCDDTNLDEEDQFCETQWVCGEDCGLKYSRVPNAHYNPPEMSNATVQQPETTLRPKKPVEDIPAKAEPHCAELQVSGGVEVSCESEDGVKINCTDALLNSRATLRCERFYTSRYRFPSVEMKCGEDRTWNPFRSFACDPDCGVLTSEYQPFVQNGQPTTRTVAFPWHGAVFRLFKNEYRYICGLTLLESALAITAAHCISSIVEIPNSANQFKIVLAPISSNFSVNAEDEISEIFDVKRAWIPPTYNQRTLKSDVALIELSNPVTFGGFIRPVCYLSRFASSQRNQIPTPGTIGKIPGFGIDETGEVSSVLKFINFPVTAPNKCKRVSPGIPSESIFCGGDENWNAAVCSGDSGGGFVFPEKRGTHIRYALRGVVSSGHLGGGNNCDPQKNTVFTHVDYFGDWIVDILEQFDMS